jgi:hypothetical protein
LYLGHLPLALDRYLAALPAMSRFPTAPFCRRILGMLSLTVEAADDLLANSRLFRGITSFHHALCQPRQLVSGQLSLGVQLICKPDHAQLLFGIEPFNFFDDLSRGHSGILTRRFDSSKRRITRTKSNERSPVLVRFIISDIKPESCKFEQSFSTDNGKTWEVNWIAIDTHVKE